MSAISPSSVTFLAAPPAMVLRFVKTTTVTTGEGENAVTTAAETEVKIVAIAAHRSGRCHVVSAGGGASLILVVAAEAPHLALIVQRQGEVLTSRHLGDLDVGGAVHLGMIDVPAAWQPRELLSGKNPDSSYNPAVENTDNMTDKYTFAHDHTVVAIAAGYTHTLILVDENTNTQRPKR